MAGIQICFLLLVFVACGLSLPSKKFDVVVYGATPAGCAAAIEASNNGKKVALIEPTPYVGGMMVPGGIGLRDLGSVGSLGGIGYNWTMVNAKHYNVNYPVYQPDMWVGAASLQSMLDAATGVQVFLSTTISTSDSVQKQGTQIVSIVTDGSSGPQSWEASVFIDASYEGDLARFAQVSYTYGRESQAQYQETYAGVRAKITSWGNFLSSYPVVATYQNGTLLPYVSSNPLGPEGSADDKMQAYSYRLCITTRKTNQAPFPKPLDYNAEKYVLLQRYLDSLVKSGKYPSGPPFSMVVDVLSYRGYPPGDKWDLCDSQSAFTSDAPDLNAGYVTASPQQRKVIEAKHYDYLAGLLTYLTTDPRVPQHTREDSLRYGLCKDQWLDNNHWPQLMYVREGLRIKGDNVMTQNDLVGGKCINNSIGIGSWGIDIHVVQRLSVRDSSSGELIANNEGQMMTGIHGNQREYELPYTLLLPKRSEATNLLVPVCNSASHVAYGSIRVEPSFVQLGQASGAAAALAINQKSTVQDVDIPSLQQILKNGGVYIHWPKGSC